MDVDQAIWARRTIKSFHPEAVERSLLDELFELARWAPNHHLTEPWRYRVLGEAALTELEEVIGPEAMIKVRRAPTLVAVSAQLDALPERANENIHATAASIYALLLAATSRGIASYWRTPGFLRTSEGALACGIPSSEVPLGLIYLGYELGEESAVAPPRRPISEFVSYLA